MTVLEKQIFFRFAKVLARTSDSTLERFISSYHICNASQRKVHRISFDGSVSLTTQFSSEPLPALAEQLAVLIHPPSVEFVFESCCSRRGFQFWHITCCVWVGALSVSVLACVNFLFDFFLRSRNVKRNILGTIRKLLTHSVKAE